MEGIMIKEILTSYIPITIEVIIIMIVGIWYCFKLWEEDYKGVGLMFGMLGIIIIVWLTLFGVSIIKVNSQEYKEHMFDRIILYDERDIKEWGSRDYININYSISPMTPKERSIQVAGYFINQEGISPMGIRTDGEFCTTINTNNCKEIERWKEQFKEVYIISSNQDLRSC
jgi:hypothetical protein